MNAILITIISISYILVILIGMAIIASLLFKEDRYHKHGNGTNHVHNSGVANIEHIFSRHPEPYFAIVWPLILVILPIFWLFTFFEWFVLSLTKLFLRGNK